MKTIIRDFGREKVEITDAEYAWKYEGDAEYAWKYEGRTSAWWAHVAEEVADVQLIASTRHNISRAKTERRETQANFYGHLFQQHMRALDIGDSMTEITMTEAELLGAALK